MRIMIRYWLAAVLLLGGSHGALAQGNTSRTLPPGEQQGRELVAELCTKCHNLDEVVRLRQSDAEWEETVYEMVGRGAPIFPDEIEVIVDYLSGVYGPAGSR